MNPMNLMLEILMMIVLLPLSSAISSFDMISRRLFPSHHQISARYRGRRGMKRLPVNFISGNIGFNFWRKDSNKDSDDSSVESIQQLKSGGRLNARRFVRNLINATRYQFFGVVERVLANDTELYEIAKQWVVLSSEDLHKVIYGLDLTSRGMKILLLKILDLDIPSKDPNVQFFLLDLCALIIRHQFWSFDRNHWRNDWTRESDVSLYDFLKQYGDVIADYIPESAWLSLNLDQAESLLDLNKESLSSHVKNYKGLFVEGLDMSNSKKLSHLPWISNSNFVYETSLHFVQDIQYNGKVNFPIHLELKRPINSRSLIFKTSFNTETKLIPEFAMFIETKNGHIRLASSLSLMSEGRRNFVQKQISRGRKTVTFRTLIDTDRMTRGGEYRMIFKLIRLSPIGGYSPNEIDGQRNVNSLISQSARPSFHFKIGDSDSFLSLPI